jgi:SPASM domain peptide maturase of grasp-with-spasm system
MIQTDLYFSVFKCCVFVKGSKKAAIYDVFREELMHIPLSLYDLIETHKNKRIIDIYNEFIGEEDILNEYFQFLKEKEIIFFSKQKDTLNNFPEIDFKYEQTNLLTNIVICFNESVELSSIVKVLMNIEDVRCKYIQLRFGPNLSFKKIENIICLFIEAEILRGLSIFINSKTYETEIGSDLFSHPIIQDVTVYNSDSDITGIDKTRFYSHSDFPCFRSLNEERFKHFQPNILSFSESKGYNSYYNRKSFINVNGDIFQSPFTEKVFGNIYKDSLKEITRTASYQQLWNVTKDKISVCKDCEFRYVCIDGRVPIKKGDNFYYSTDCKYSPYEE